MIKLDEITGSGRFKLVPASKLFALRSSWTPHHRIKSDWIDPSKLIDIQSLAIKLVEFNETSSAHILNINWIPTFFLVSEHLWFCFYPTKSVWSNLLIGRKTTAWVLCFNYEALQTFRFSFWFISEINSTFFILRSTQTQEFNLCRYFFEFLISRSYIRLNCHKQPRVFLKASRNYHSNPLDLFKIFGNIFLFNFPRVFSGTWSNGLITVMMRIFFVVGTA